METTTEKAEAEEAETRVEEHAVGMLGHLGFKGRLPDGLVETYNDFKKVKDKIQPGRLSAEGYALVVCLFNLKRELGAA